MSLASAQTTAPDPVTASVPATESVVGYVDGVFRERVGGWAWDRRHPGKALEIELCVDGAAVMRFVADRTRRDLADAGIGDGAHAFYVEVEHALPVDEPQRIALFAIAPDDGRRVALQRAGAVAPRPAGAGPVASVPEAFRRWLSDFRDAQASLERSLQEASTTLSAASTLRDERNSDDSRRVNEQLAALSKAQENVARQLGTLEVVQLRLDETAASFKRSEAEQKRRDTAELWLRRAVFGLALLSSASLAIGIVSLLR